MEKNLVTKELKQIWNNVVTVTVAVANMITSIPMKTIWNTHHFIICCVHLHIDTNIISIYKPTSFWRRYRELIVNRDL